MQFLIYDIKAASLLAVFYVFYKLLLERETLYRLSRVILLFTALLSLMLPLCVVTFHKEIALEANKYTLDNTIGNGMRAVEVYSSGGGTLVDWQFWEPVITLLFFAGCLSCIAKTFLGIRKIYTLLANSETITLDNSIRVAVTDSNVAPFSWMNTVVVARDDYERYVSEDRAGWQMVLAHELGHIRGRHSLDVVFMELLTALQWFNPVAWLFKQELRAIHEYEADANVLSQGCDTSLYVQMLMHKAMGINVYALANGISNSLIKKRVKRMFMKKSDKARAFKALYIVPITAISLLATANTVIDYKYVESDSPDLSVTEKVKTDSALIGAEGQRRIPVYGERQEINAKESLLIVDGQEVSYETWKALVENNRESIESMYVLKEESGRKLYGEKGAKGVLIANLFKNQPVDDDPVFDICEKMPEFDDGGTKLYEFIAKTVRYPQRALESGVQGRVIVQFVVEKDGSLSNVHALSASDFSVNNLNEVVVTSYQTEMNDEERSALTTKIAAHQALVDEAIRVVKAMPRWKPGRQNGQPVRAKFVLPVTFRLS